MLVVTAVMMLFFSLTKNWLCVLLIVDWFCFAVVRTFVVE
jgi:hypothetical protein